MEPWYKCEGRWVKPCKEKRLTCDVSLSLCTPFTDTDWFSVVWSRLVLGLGEGKLKMWSVFGSICTIYHPWLELTWLQNHVRDSLWYLQLLQLGAAWGVAGLSPLPLASSASLVPQAEILELSKSIKPSGLLREWAIIRCYSPLLCTYSGELFQQNKAILPAYSQLLKGLMTLNETFNFIYICPQLCCSHQRFLSCQPGFCYVSISPELQHLQHWDGEKGNILRALRRTVVYLSSLKKGHFNNQSGHSCIYTVATRQTKLSLFFLLTLWDWLYPYTHITW